MKKNDIEGEDIFILAVLVVLSILGVVAAGALLFGLWLVTPALPIIIVGFFVGLYVSIKYTRFGTFLGDKLL